MTTQPLKKKRKQTESEWPALLLGWIFIIVVLFGIVFMVLHAKPEKKWVCKTVGRTPSLTQFGSCHKE